MKTILIIAALATCVNVNSQNKPLTMGVKAGVNYSNMSGDTDNTNDRIGYDFGMTNIYEKIAYGLNNRQINN